MHVTVFGATGGIGRHVVRQLLDEGHQVTVLVRSPAKLAITHPALTILTGSLSDRAAVEQAVTGADAVISALGPSMKRSVTGTPLTDGAHIIVAATREQKVDRFIGLATPSLADPQDKPHWKHKVLPVMARLMFPNALIELRGMTEAVTDSDLDYTIARITNPTNKPATGHVRSGFLGHDRVGSVMSREDIAAFLVSQLTDTRYRRAMPAISN
ncbi:MAG: SDR family NAD(P)-dependent oxidoreductase [Streptomyces sp.]|nr:SDR family NAD(P)-dependent oxidoreductase [Streptomyces sp.]NUT24928.1 SDR family NAD(P)-dependent oxidoreductase [Streptomyces sp.]